MSTNPAFVDDDGSSGSLEETNIADGNNKRQSATRSAGNRKRGRKATGDAIVDAMLQIANASKLRAAAITKSEDRFSISKCIKVLDEMQGINQNLYFFALDLLENSSAREMFLSLRNERRETWLQRKFLSSSTSAIQEMDDSVIQRVQLLKPVSGFSIEYLHKPEHGKGKVVEIQDRYDAAKEIERSLLELHQIFMDMAVMVEAQGEKMDDIEHHVMNAAHNVNDIKGIVGNACVLELYYY